LLQDALQGGGGNWLKMQNLINELNDIYGLSPKEEYVTPAPNGLGHPRSITGINASLNPKERRSSASTGRKKCFCPCQLHTPNSGKRTFLPMFMPSEETMPVTYV